MLAEVEAGVGCPLSMTYSAIPALRLQPELAAEWEPRLTSTVYDPRLIPANGKAGALSGMAMTEKQGGSDVRAEEDDDAHRGKSGEPSELTVARHRADLFSLSYDVPNDVLRKSTKS